MKKLFLLAAVIAIGGVAYLALNKYSSNSPSSQLETDVSASALQFVQRDQTLTPELQKIHGDILALLTAKEPNNADYLSQFWLVAVGRRYVLISQPSAGSSYDEIVDSHTGTIRTLPNGASYAHFYRAFEGGGNMAIYIGDKDIYTYTLDQESFVLVPGSKLSGTETYTSGAYDSPAAQAEQVHTDTSITISVFDSSQLVPNPDVSGAKMYKKIRKVTLRMP